MIPGPPESELPTEAAVSRRLVTLPGAFQPCRPRRARGPCEVNPDPNALGRVPVEGGVGPVVHAWTFVRSTSPRPLVALLSKASEPREGTHRSRPPRAREAVGGCQQPSQPPLPSGTAAASGRREGGTPRREFPPPLLSPRGPLRRNPCLRT